MKTIYAPHRQDPSDELVNVFLAGSIDMGNAENWQPIVTQEIEQMPEVGYIYNPRRLDFQDDAEQRIENDYFREQVEWELDYITVADIVFMHLDPKSKSPISLLELGYVSKEQDVVVCCPNGFWRKGNVDIVCKREGISVFEDLDSSLEYLKILIRLKSEWV